MSGFTQVPNEVLHNPDLSPAAKLVYLALLSVDHGGRKGKAWPTHAFLANVSGFSRRQVIRAIKELEGVGLLSVRSRPGSANTYTLNLRCNGKGIIDRR